MVKKLSVYIFCFNLIFIPYQRANAFIPAVGIAYAFDAVAPIAIRYLADEIAISAVIKAVKISDAYYSSTARISNANFLKFFKSKSVLGAAAFLAVLDGIGYYLTNENTFAKPGTLDIVSGDVIPQAGYVWAIGSFSGVNVTDVASKYCSNTFYCQSIEIVEIEDSDTSRKVNYITSTGGYWAGSGQIARKVACSVRSSYNAIATCQDGYIAPTAEPVLVDDITAEKTILTYVQSLPEDKQKELLADSDGIFDQDLVDSLVADNVPPMPDGETPIPYIGHSSWINANYIASGTAQSANISAPNYVSSDDWDEAYYLANDIANSNSYITSLNSGDISAVDNPSSSSSDADSGADVAIDVDLSGVEERLDTGNELSSSMLDELKQLNSSTVNTINEPNKNIAKSFWDSKYPDGLDGIFDNFMNKIKSTGIYAWVASFNTNLGSGEIPIYSVCFNNIGSIDFGCYELKADSYIWLSIRASLILTAVIVSRKIVFGG